MRLLDAERAALELLAADPLGPGQRGQADALDLALQYLERGESPCGNYSDRRAA